MFSIFSLNRVSFYVLAKGGIKEVFFDELFNLMIFYCLISSNREVICLYLSLMSFWVEFRLNLCASRRLLTKFFI